MRLVSWNVAARVRCIADQIAALRSRVPDVVALQEVTASTVTPLLDGLNSMGLIYSVNSLALAARPEELIGPRRSGELLASRWPLHAMRPEEFLVPWPEKILSAVLEAPRTTVEVHVVHVPPGSSNGWTKIRTFEGIFARLATESKHPRILCRDFNSPREEMDDGRTITLKWAQTWLHLVVNPTKSWNGLACSADGINNHINPAINDLMQHDAMQAGVGALTAGALGACAGTGAAWFACVGTAFADGAAASIVANNVSFTNACHP
jgi:exonuclease III